LYVTAFINHKQSSTSFRTNKSNEKITNNNQLHFVQTHELTNHNQKNIISTYQLTNFETNQLATQTSENRTFAIERGDRESGVHALFEMIHSKSLAVALFVHKRKANKSSVVFCG
jgi:hypothetical protein